MIGPSVQTEPLFDAVGQENPDARYRFLPFDVAVGHEELLILWDDTVPGEEERFDAALRDAQVLLQEVPASYRGQNTAMRLIPVVPRNAALRIAFQAQGAEAVLIAQKVIGIKSFQEQANQ